MNFMSICRKKNSDLLTFSSFAFFKGVCFVAVDLARLYHHLSHHQDSSCLTPPLHVLQDSEDDSMPTFKCIGAQSRTVGGCQKKLKDGNTSAIKLSPEPDNPKDSKAIAFKG